MIELARIAHDLGARRLFDELSLRLNDRDHFALVGPNGSGKTTLLRMMAGLLTADSGQVARTKGLTLGYLPQEGIALCGRSIGAEARSVFDDLLALKSEVQALEERLEGGHADEALLTRYHEATEAFRHKGGFEIESRVASVLDGLGFGRGQWEHDAATLSGGWQMRLALAKLLIQRPDVLLLDEPTNHLDLLANNWLEGYLKEYEGAFLLVSHDRHFLDNIITHVCELAYATVRVYSGNYTRYLTESAKELEILEEKKRRQDEEIERMERFINKFRYQATKARQVQSRIKMLDKVERIELPRDQAQVRFRFPEPPRSGRIAIELKGVAKAYGDQVVFRGLDLTVERGVRLALVGPNGAGKSTLIRILAGREPHHGERKLGHNVDLAYFAQDEGASLDPRKTILDEVGSVAPLSVVASLRNLLGSFLFKGDDVFKPVGVLSGGEKTRVALAKMLLEPHNLLLLDEPTNHLDLASKEVLLQSLIDYPGTIVLVSHDRYFLDRLANRIADVGNGGVSSYPGGYEEYLSRPGAAPVAAAAPPSSSPVPRTAPVRRPSPPAPASKPAVKVRDAARRNDWHDRERKKKRDQLEKRIEELEAEARAIEQKMGLPGFFGHPSSRTEVERHQRLQAEVKGLYLEWETLA